MRKLLRQFDSYIDANIDTAIQVTNTLKAVLSSPVADLVTAIIPGEVDDILKAQLLKALEKAVQALLIADSCKQYSTLNEKLACFAQQLNQRDPQLRDAVLLKLASLLAGFLDSQRFKQHVYDLYTQVKYSAIK